MNEIPANWEPIIWMGPLRTEPAVYAPPSQLLSVCNKCDFTGPHQEHEIHEGQSLRRDCGQCGRTLGFPLWNRELDPSLKPVKKPRQRKGAA